MEFRPRRPAQELLEQADVSRSTALVRGIIAALVLLASSANADIFVLRAPDGGLLITNRGQKSGYKVISRHREFKGSSGMGLWLRENPDAAKYDEVVRGVAQQFSLDPWLVKAVIRAESNFNPMATSPKGAMGLMQLMPDTARMHEVKNAYDPAQNVLGGARHLRYLIDRYAGQLDLVLAAYNAGTKPVDAIRGIPSYPETQEYVRRVNLFHESYKNAAARVAVGFPTADEQQAKTKLTEALAKLEIGKRPAADVYGVPLILRAH
jgi:hypothetical protein